MHAPEIFEGPRAPYGEGGVRRTAVKTYLNFNGSERGGVAGKSIFGKTQLVRGGGNVLQKTQRREIMEGCQGTVWNSPVNRPRGLRGGKHLFQNRAERTNYDSHNGQERDGCKWRRGKNQSHAQKRGERASGSKSRPRSGARRDETSNLQESES